MRVYRSKGSGNSILPGIIITIVFLAISIGVFIAFFTSDKSFSEMLYSSGIVLLFAIIFFAFGMFFVFSLVRRPKGYRAKLISKKIETYKDKQITSMKFKLLKTDKEDAILSEFYCYTIGDNNLVVGNEYSLKIKEFNWEPKFVEELNYVYEKSSDKTKDKLPKLAMFPVFLSVGLIFGAMFFVCIYEIIKGQNIMFYSFLGGFFGMCLFFIFTAAKSWKENDDDLEDESEEDEEDSDSLEE